MPELPEVETIRSGLEKCIKGKRVTRVEVHLPSLVKYPEADEFAALMEGRVFEQIGRRGKYLLLHLSGGYILVVHLRMTGRLYYQKPSHPRSRHTYVVFHLDDGYELRFVEPRRFGTLHLVREGELAKAGGLEKLGMEPLDEKFTLDCFRKILNGKKGKIKSLLLDQTVIAGVGNIYADEALFRAGIHPERSAGSLSGEETVRLYEALREVILLGIKYRGSSVQSYYDVEGEKGEFQNYHNVYHRRGEPCKVCGEEIRRIEVGGRGTHYCPSCQK